MNDPRKHEARHGPMDSKPEEGECREATDRMEELSDQVRNMAAQDPVDPVELRFTYHQPPDERTVERHERVRKTVRRCAEDLLEDVPPGRERSVVLTKLEEAMMWANAGIARSHASGLD